MLCIYVWNTQHPSLAACEWAVRNIQLYAWLHTVQCVSSGKRYLSYWTFRMTLCCCTVCIQGYGRKAWSSQSYVQQEGACWIKWTLIIPLIWSPRSWRVTHMWDLWGFAWYVWLQDVNLHTYMSKQLKFWHFNRNIKFRKTRAIMVWFSHPKWLGKAIDEVWVFAVIKNHMCIYSSNIKDSIPDIKNNGVHLQKIYNIRH